MKSTDHPAHERKSIADLAVLEPRHDDPAGLSARERRDLADAEWRYADRQAHAWELELRAEQSIGASVRSMYAVAGRGEY